MLSLRCDRIFMISAAFLPQSAEVRSLRFGLQKRNLNLMTHQLDLHMVTDKCWSSVKCDAICFTGLSMIPGNSASQFELCPWARLAVK